MKLTFRLKGGKGSGFHGHLGRPGKVGGSTALTSSLHKILWTANEFNKVAYADDIISGFEQVISINGPKIGEGNFSVYVNAGTSTVGFDKDGKLSTTFNDFAKLQGTAIEVMNKAHDMLLNQRDEYINWLNKKIDERLDNESDVLTECIWDYRNMESHDAFGELIDNLKKDPISYMQAKRIVNEELTFDNKGYITLYRGGTDKGVSWSIRKEEAERFARYGFGNVPVQASAIIGIHAILRGAESKPVSINERKFHKSELLLSMLSFGEGEVIVDPDAL